MTETIKELSHVLADFLGEQKKIIGTQISRLTAPGENYGSIMLKVEVTVKHENTGKEEVLHVVGKLIPQNAIIQEIFNIQVTYKNEVAFYKTIVPTLVSFQREHGVTDVLDCFAKYYGSRINLNGSEVVDNDAVLLLENLKLSGYNNINRYNGFDLETTEFILKDCAMMHAVAIAMKLKKPDLFEKNVRQYCHDYIARKHHAIGLYEMTKIILNENPKCAPLAHKLKYWCQDEDKRTIREPFATLTHCDMWVNNLMQKFENGKIVGNKFVDFQVFTYRSPAADLFFLLWSSVCQKILIQKLDYFIEYYHKHFIRYLKELHCETTPFSYQNLLEELRIESEFEFGHAIVFKIFVVHGKKSSEFDGGMEAEDKEKFLKLVSQEAKEQAWEMVLECEKRGWF